ncbi:hypothetical protein DVDV_3357 [Desulfovibrio sp. DV]|nr:hypothetical protein DVDV_3357 [Desulfovibrio sp. DV]
MECSLTVEGLPPARFFLPHTASPAGSGSAVPCRRGQPCPTARRAGGCLLPAAIKPVLQAFSPVLSHARVRLTLRRGGELAEVEETGQWAAFRLLIAAMRDSGCPFFGPILPAGTRLVPQGDGSKTFRRMVRALTFPWPEAAGGLTALSLARCGREIESHLHAVLGEARRHCRQDAAVNAVILMYNCTRLAVEDGGEAQRPQPTAA